jgi:hypothetical protein
MNDFTITTGPAQRYTADGLHHKDDRFHEIYIDFPDGREGLSLGLIAKFHRTCGTLHAWRIFDECGDDLPHVKCKHTTKKSAMSAARECVSMLLG